LKHICSTSGSGLSPLEQTVPKPPSKVTFQFASLPEVAIEMKDEKIILQTDSVKVRIMELDRGETAPLHRHSHISDHMFGLSGEILVRMRNPDQDCLLTAGAHCTVEAGRAHQVLNKRKDQTAKYLLVQGVGPYDFLPDI